MVESGFRSNPATIAALENDRRRVYIQSYGQTKRVVAGFPVVATLGKDQ